MELVLITAADKLSTPSSVLALKHVHTQAFFLQLRPGSQSSVICNIWVTYKRPLIFASEQNAT